jgi:hypothetical protein
MLFESYRSYRQIHTDGRALPDEPREPNIGRMDVHITIEDAKAYLKPWTVKFYWELLADTELLGDRRHALAARCAMGTAIFRPNRNLGIFHRRTSSS